MSPAEQLREAARRVRDAAGQATPGPWSDEIHESIHGLWAGVCSPAPEDDEEGEGAYVVATAGGSPSSEPEHNAEYIALMDPQAGAALANLIEQVAELVSNHDWPYEDDAALAVARALGVEG